MATQRQLSVVTHCTHPGPCLTRPVFQEQHADLLSMMLNNELVMVEEKLLSAKFVASDSASSGGLALWLQQLHLLKQCLIHLDLDKLELVDTALDAQNFEALVNLDDLGLALAHASQRAAALAGHVNKSHKLACGYLEDCIRCKANEVSKLVDQLEQEKASRKDIVLELSQQHETIASLMELGPEWLNGPADTDHT